MTRQEVLTTRKPPLRLRSIVGEPALMLQVGSADLMREQLEHIAKVAALPNVTVQVLRLTAGAPLAVHSGFEILTFDKPDPPLGYIETLAGELFLESSEEIRRLTSAYGVLKSLAASSVEPARHVRAAQSELLGTVGDLAPPAGGAGWQPALF